jgi:RNA polymerase sigma-70 factor (ECF subfamily)
MGAPGVDPNLVDSALRGDPAAFRSVFDELSPKVYQIAYSLLRDRDDAQDVVQETFISVQRNMSTFRGEADFGVWVARIARNRAHDVLRRRKRSPLRIEELGAASDESDPVAWEPPAPSVPQADHGLKRILNEEIEALPEKLRECLVLREVAGLAYEEIADTMQIPLNTVRTRLLRAREQLRAKLTARLGEEAR